MRVRIGTGEMVSQLGHTDSGIPCVILEPVKDDEIGKSGQPGPGRLNSGDVAEGGIIFEIHSEIGALVLIQDLSKAALRIGVPEDANKDNTL